MKAFLLLALLLTGDVHAQGAIPEPGKYRFFEAKEVKKLPSLNVFHTDPLARLENLKASFTWNGDSKEEQERKLAAFPVGGYVGVSIAAKTRAASHGSNFETVVTDAKGKEVARMTGPDEYGEAMPKFAGGGGYQIVFDVPMKEKPEFPITVNVTDKLAKKEAEWKIIEKK